MTTRTLPFPSPTRRIALLAVAVCLLSAASLRAADEYYSLAGLKAAGFQKWIDNAKSQGYEIIYINGCQVGDHVEYSGVAEKHPDGKVQGDARFDMTEQEYKDYAGEMKDKGFRPIGLSGYHSPHGLRFAASWKKVASWSKDNASKNMEWDFKLSQSQKEFEKTLADEHAARMFPYTITAYQGNDGGVRFTSVYVTPRKDQTWETGYNLTAEQFQDRLDRWDSDGFVPFKIHAYDTPDGLRFLATASKSAFDSSVVVKVRFGLTGDQYQKAFDELAAEGYSPICICGYHDGEDVKFAVVWRKMKK
jgi:hypothetical protein